MSILVLNAGSSTLKFALFDASASEELASGVIDWLGGSTPAMTHFRSPSAVENKRLAGTMDNCQAVSWILECLTTNGFSDPIRAVGHRVVHGGTDFTGPTLIDDHVYCSLQSLSHLAPLHNPPALSAITAAREALPAAKHVAAFDTAFFAGLPERATIYPLPYAWLEQYGIRRYGFHGISHQYCTARATEMLNECRAAHGRLVICHLGNGCSATAVRDGQPQATTMGFTPLEGLMMGTRSGSVDPGILLYLVRECGLQVDTLQESLNRQSGLLGVSGVSSDFREVEKAAAAGNQRAGLAIDLFVERVRATIGGLVVTLGGLDALIFTAGIGTHSATLRSRVCDGLQCLNLKLDEQLNQQNFADSNIAATGSTARILLIRTREEQAIAGATLALIR